MLAVHVSTVGKTSEPILNGFRTHIVDHQILLFSKETADVARRIKQQIESLSARKMCELVEVDPFNMHDIVSKILSEWRRFRGSEFYVNITGGTNIMASSALVACFMTGANAYYMKESASKEAQPIANSIVRIPVPRVSLDSLDSTQTEILRHILDCGGSVDKANVSLSEKIGDAPQLISYHLKELKRKELVDVVLKGREKTVTLTDSGRFYAQLRSS